MGQTCLLRKLEQLYKTAYKCIIRRYRKENLCLQKFFQPFGIDRNGIDSRERREAFGQNVG